MMRRALLILVMALLSSLGAQAQSTVLVAAGDYLSPEQEKAELDQRLSRQLESLRLSEGVVVAKAARLNAAALLANVVKFTTPSGHEHTLTKVRGTELPQSARIWSGTTEYGGVASFHVKANEVVGDIDDHSGTIYRVVSSGRYHLISEINIARFRRDQGNDVLQMPGLGKSSKRAYGEVQALLGIPVVDVLVLYTSMAKTAASDKIDEVIQKSIVDLNSSFVNSGVNLAVRLAAASQIALWPNPGLETGWVPTTALNELSGKTGQTNLSYLARRERDRVHADVVILIGSFKFATECGAAWGGPAMPEWAFATVDVKCIGSPYYTLAHEFGHLLGADHNTQNATTATYVYGHGANFSWYVNFRSTTVPNGYRCFRTIMAYSYASFGGPPCKVDFRINNWSNPAIYYTDKAPFTTPAEPDQSYTVATGSGSCCNNARVLNENGAFASTYSSVSMLAGYQQLQVRELVNILLLGP
ncbi:M12 family metallo-peptidase [Paucibacter sp. APW11]|uniref:M12 family metallo-peptidase n=1 Tax=Roseateles aquae TaxID=3077235 RepID=A0ABU3PCM9_9BURK|nr:M12 family metallo-peptidase [Paucibacter sp. APW11]MDT9000340.1 M12 family metallo-peptidase [Paucibacter sp. APW11]